MKYQKYAYWTTTALVAFAFAFGGFMDFVASPEVVRSLEHLGYPAYFATFLGAWKMAGAVAIAVPGFPRLKEWAYAGMLFDLTGAAYSHAMSGDPTPNILTPLVLLALGAASWALRPASRRLSASNSETHP